MTDQKLIACQDCGMELPGGVVDAGAFLYGGTQLSVDRLTGFIERFLKTRAEDDASRANLGIDPATDSDIGPYAVLSLVDDIEDDELTAAVKHWGDLGDPNGSECERTNWARWCHKQGPGKDSPAMAVWAASLCNLEAGHEGLHSFEQQPASVTPR
jgi:hypothetical protein